MSCCCNPQGGTAPAALPFFAFAENNADFTTGSVAPVACLSLVTAVLAVGTYLVEWYGETTESAIAFSSTVQILIDATIVAETRHGEEVDILDNLGRSGVAFLVVAAPASHTIAMFVGVTAGTVTIRRRRLTIQQVL